MPKKPTKKTVKKAVPRKSVKTVAKVKKTVKKTVEKPKAVSKSRAKSAGTPEVKSDLVKKYRGGAKDTGSVAVQIALLTDRINALAKHLSKHIHDFDSKRGLLILVGKRRRLLNYLRKNDEKVYTNLVKDLKLKK